MKTIWMNISGRKIFFSTWHKIQKFKLDQHKISFLYFFLIFLTTACGPFFAFQENNPYFWTAKKEGRSVYLLGTHHHSISLDELPCSDTIIEKLAASGLVLTELGGPQNTQTQGPEWEEVLYYSPNNEDFEQLSPEHQRFLDQKGISRDLSYNALIHTVSLSCLQDVVGESALYISMDEQVESLATYLHIPIQALDTLELRKPLAEYVSTKEVLEAKIDNYYLCPELQRTLITYYKTGGIESLLDPSEINESDRWLLKNRNESWFKQLKSVPNNHNNHNPIFVAAGVLHFIGAFNVIDMLRRDGFNVERATCQQPSSGPDILRGRPENIPLITSI